MTRRQTTVGRRRSGPSPKLVVNAAEAARVRDIFSLYLTHGSLLPVVQELVRRGWDNKAWKTKAGTPKGAQPFDRGTLHALLTNPLYAGKLRHKTDLYDGEHERIIDPEVFQKVQARLQHNCRSGGTEVRNRYGSLLKRLLYCKACGHTMIHNFTGRNGKRYRYYTCTHAIKSGRAACPSGSLPAAEVEQLVVDRIRCIAHDRTLRVEVLRQAQMQVAAELENLETESGGLRRDLARYHAELQKLTADGPVRGAKADRTADLQCLIAQAETRLSEVRVQLQKQQDERVEEHDVLAAFADFDGVWSTLSPREQAQVLTLLVERVEFDAATSEIVVSFHPSAIKTLAHEQRGEAV